MKKKPFEITKDGRIIVLDPENYNWLAALREVMKVKKVKEKKNG